MDGVLTDNTLLHLNDTEWLRRTNMKDGHAIKLAGVKGYKVALISGSTSEPVRARLKHLGVEDVYMGIDDKKEKLQAYIKENQLDPEKIMYMGDDVKDYPAMLLVGLPCCPADAVGEVREISKYISPYKGGEGCARDVVEKVLKLHGNWELH